MKKWISILILGVWGMNACSDSRPAKPMTTQKNKLFRSDSLHMAFEYPDGWEVRTNGDHIGLFEPLENTGDNFQENIMIWTEEMPIGISDSLYSKAATAELKIKNPSLKVDITGARKLGSHTFYSFNFNVVRGDSSSYHVIGYTLMNGKRGYNISCTSTAAGMEKHQAVFDAILSTFKPL